MVATLTSKGQLTIPVDIRRKLDLHEGDRVSFVFTEGHCEMIPMRRSIRDLKGTLPKPAKRLSLEQMEDAVTAGARG